MIPFIIYLIIVNAAAFLLMHVDKHRARKKLWRISENTLLATALMGGSIGCLAGMHCARHKTKHLKFSLGIPIILALQIVLTFIIYTSVTI